MTIAVKITLIEDADTHPSGSKSDVRPCVDISYLNASTRGPIEKRVGEVLPARREITVHLTELRDVRLSVKR